MPYGMNYGMPLGMGLRGATIAPKAGILGRLGGVTGAIKGINWGGLLNIYIELLAELEKISSHFTNIAERSSAIQKNYLGISRLKNAAKQAAKQAQTGDGTLTNV